MPEVRVQVVGGRVMAVWLVRDSGLFTGRVDLSREPCPADCGAGVYGVKHGQYRLEVDMPKPGHRREDEGGTRHLGAQKKGDKPPYRVPSMAEVAAVPWNGMTVASTFSGCGGSCLGYRMAGFRVGWANEFVPSAQESYRLNMAEGGHLDPRDVRTVQPEDVLKQLGIRKGELDLFDGSPPCQAFSTAGKRHKGWGEKKRYEGGHEQQNEDLFQEYVRLLRGLMPRTFVAENVSGLVKGTCKGMFLEILKALKGSGYRVRAAVLDAQWLGVPQVRKRVIFVGIRGDLRDSRGKPLEPCHPDPLPWRYSVLDALPWLGQGGGIDQGAVYDEDMRWSGAGEPSPTVSLSGIGAQVKDRVRLVGVNRSTQWQNGERWDGPEEPHPTVGVGPSSGCGKGGGSGMEVALAGGGIERRRFTIAELRRICGFPDDFLLAGSYARQWERLGNSVPPPMAFWTARTLRDRVLRVERGRKLPGPIDPPSLVVGTT